MAGQRVFVAQLAGLPVFGSAGESIGKVRDIVAALRLDRHPPRVLGIVVDLPTRRPIFVPMLRVASIEPRGIALTSGSVSLRRFEQRRLEVLLLGQLLGARARIATTAGSATLVDVAIEPTRTRDWVVAKVAVRERAGRLARRTPVQVLAWGDVRGLDPAELTGTTITGTEQLLASFEGIRPADAATVIRDLPAARRYEVADALDDERLADVIEELPEEDQKDLLSHLDEGRAADILEAMDPDDAADLLAELPSGISERLLELMEPEESGPVRRLLQYSFDTAGGLMTPEPVVLTPDATIAEALARVRSPDLTPALASMVFVCRPPQATPTGRYLGCVHTQRLLREPPFELVAGAVDSEMARLSPGAGLAEVTRFFAAYNLVCAPVVDEEDHLLGAVTVDDVLDHLLPENWRELGLAEMGIGERPRTAAARIPARPRGAGRA
ncbi:magnesium transporter MgtE N-terminal domain-containing protein [Nakamurella endophytica]|uniref:Magnesium transporter n=1 Tax=Nakamurella endophytica TaxID=1748367 RepID=A0A917T316_9ACTN|nr:CBS domain-containing protein [Nakamurella endophytica]GGM07488.1 magnesium transporter [Nakamurella endophytica]